VCRRRALVTFPHTGPASVPAARADTIDDMKAFRADVEFRFAAESLEAASADIRRLVKASADVGFELKRVKVEPAPPDDDADEWTGYAPLDP
jgi:hypothetical protein